MDLFAWIQRRGNPSALITEATSGTEGLRRVRQEAPDAVLLDLGMPDVSGEEVLEQLRADATTATVPVLIVTSKIVGEAERQRLVRHAVAIVDKGSDREVAAAQIRAALTAAAVFEA